MDTSIHGHTATQVPPRSIPKSNQKSYCPLFSPYPDIFALLGFPRACPGWTRCPGSGLSIAVTPAAPALVFPSHPATINPFSMPGLEQGWHQPQVRKAKPKANTKLKKNQKTTHSILRSSHLPRQQGCRGEEISSWDAAFLVFI